MENKYMRLAVTEAEKAEKENEVPVGAVIVKDGTVVATGRNRRESENNALCHAEIEAINNACKALGSWRLSDCELYVTLEPCPMCAGAILNAKLGRVIFGAKDPRGGALGSLIDLRSYPFYHKPRVTSGVCADECKALLSEFFKNKRS